MTADTTTDITTNTTTDTTSTTNTTTGSSTNGTNGTNGSDAEIAPTTPIRPTELGELRAADACTRILDVRSGAEFESAHIPGSFNVPLDQLAEHVHRMAELDHPVVLVCQSGSRAATAQAKLNTAGKLNVRVLDGGMEAWRTSGGDVVEGEQKWSLERQVRGVAGGIVLASILAGSRYPKARFVAGGVGFGLTFSAVSNSCTMGLLLAKLPYNRGPQCVLDDVLADMQR
jgi:rhodanese-related sulfurtransferase